LQAAETKIIPTTQHLRAIRTGQETFFGKKDRNLIIKNQQSPFFSRGGSYSNPVPFFPKCPIQPKLTKGRPRDIYDKEADPTVDQVVQQPSTGPRHDLRRTYTECSTDQEKTIVPKIRREGNDKHHEKPKLSQTKPIHPLRPGPVVQRYAVCEGQESCPTREPGEVGRSRTAPMELFIMSGGANGMMMSNFSVESSQIKGDPTSNANWNRFVGDMASNPNITWDILGFSDCQGNEGTNSSLRTARATELYLALPDDAKAQVENYGGAPLTECMRNNSTETDRSLNRSAIMRRKSTSYEFEPETIQGDSSRVVYLCSKPLDTSPFGSHAFFRLDSPTAGNETLSLQPIQVIRAGDCWQGIPAMNYPSDQNATGTCERTTIRWADLFREYSAYPVGHYCTLGPNSNTFVGHLARRTGMTDPDPEGWTPGLDASPPPVGTFAPDKWSTLSGCETKECIPDAMGDGTEADHA
jgi:hypothetical protein